MVVSPLGPISARIKTDVRLPQTLSARMDEMCDLLGLKRNSFMTISISRFCIELAGMQPSLRKRKALINDIRVVFNKLVDSVEKDL